MKPPGQPARNRRKPFIFAVAAICLMALAWILHNHVSLEDLALQESRLRDAIAAHPWRSFVIGFGVYAIVALVPGTGGKAIVYGWLFGFWQAVAIVTAGLAMAATAIFLLSRYLFRESIERRLPRFIGLINRNLQRNGAFYLVSLRMVHAPYSVVNPVIGASRVRIWTFLWTTVIGLLPPNALWVYVGIRLPSLRELADRGVESFVDLPLIGALVLCGVLPFLIRWLLHRSALPAAGDRCRDAAIYQPQEKNR